MAEEFEEMEEQGQDVVDEIRGQLDGILNQFQGEEDEAIEQLREGLDGFAAELAKAKGADTFREEDVDGPFEDWVAEVGPLGELEVPLRGFIDGFKEDCRAS